MKTRTGGHVSKVFIQSCGAVYTKVADLFLCTDFI